MPLKFTDWENKDLFIFNEHEYPEKLPKNIEVKLNKIRYPDGHHTNQIIGRYPGEIEWSGKFFGTYLNGNDFISALERSDEIEKLLEKVIKVNYDIGGEIGKRYAVVIEQYKRDIINLNEVDYTILLVPHETQTRIKPTKAVDAKSTANNASNAAAKGDAKAQAVKPKAGKKPVVRPGKGAKPIQPPKPKPPVKPETFEQRMKRVYGANVYGN